MAKKPKKPTVSMQDSDPLAPGTQVRVLKLPTDNIPQRVKQICDAMLVDSYRLSATFVYDDHLVLVFQ